MIILTSVLLNKDYIDLLILVDIQMVDSKDFSMLITNAKVQY